MSEAAVGTATTTAATTTTGSTVAAPWYEGKVDAEIIGHWDNKGWKKDDPIAVAVEASKAARELQKHFGVPADQLLRLPKDPTDEAGWANVRQRLGAPKEAKEYDFSSIKFSDGTELEQSFTDTMRNALHRVGAAKDTAPEVVKAVVKFMEDADSAETTAKQATLQAQRAELQREWGSNFDFNRLTAMQGAKRAVGGDEAQAASVIAAMEQAIGYKNTMEFWRKIGAGTTEDTFVQPGQNANPTTMNGAKARIAELQSDQEWTARYLKGGAKERAEMDNLIALVYGSAA